LKEIGFYSMLGSSKLIFTSFAQGLWAVGGIFIVPHLLWHGPLFFRSHPKDRPNQSPPATHMGMWRIYSNPDPHGSLILNKYDKHTPGKLHVLILMKLQHF
jgi:hypothetical protein